MARNASGYRFEREVVASAKAYDMHAFKIPTNIFATFAVKGVYDILTIHKGIIVGIECKAISSEEAFPFARLEPHQILALKSLHDAGGRAYLLINLRVRPYRTYYLSINEYLRLREHYRIEGRKSIPIDDLKQLPEIKRTRNPSNWDIRVLFEDNNYV